MSIKRYKEIIEQLKKKGYAVEKMTLSKAMEVINNDQR